LESIAMRTLRSDDSESRIQLIKREVREEIWRYLEDHDLARFPRPVYNRIPNFVGAEKAASFMRKLKEFSDARVVKVNPDSPQVHVRRLILKEGKTLLMPTPRLSSGFLKLEPEQIQKHMIDKAATIAGAFHLADKVPLNGLPMIDLIVAGSVAVSLKGGRIGKGEGYSELEYGILRECGLVTDDVKVVTTVHDCQIVKPFPVQKHDVPVDYILTPTRMQETHTALPKPKGIYWDCVTMDMLHEMPILGELREQQMIRRSVEG